jgi:hypothetical protein
MPWVLKRRAGDFESCCCNGNVSTKTGGPELAVAATERLLPFAAAGRSRDRRRSFQADQIHDEPITFSDSVQLCSFPELSACVAPFNRHRDNVGNLK